MGLDATVRCTCFEDGLMKDPPVPFSDIFVDDEDGFLVSRTLEDARSSMSSEDFDHLFGQLDDRFNYWQDHACEHECMEVCSERIGNICTWAFLKRVFEEMGRERAPYLYDMLPDANGGCYPNEKAAGALEELPIFLRYIEDNYCDDIDLAQHEVNVLTRLLNASIETGNPINWC